MIKNVVLKVELWGVGHVFFSIMSGVGHQNFVPLRGVGSCFFQHNVRGGSSKFCATTGGWVMFFSA